MTSPSIESVAYGKWILAGEHAVIRGSPALVFPVFSRQMSLRFTPSDQPLAASFSGTHGSELELLFWGVFERAVLRLGLPRSEFNGSIEIASSIPVGGGLGASAALCVNVGRWMSKLGHVKESELYEFARQLENLFHGESSGVDIAIALSGRGLHFERNGKKEVIEPNWKPQWFISYSGKRGVTAECVNRVKSLWEKDALRAERIDRDMKEAVLQAEEALLGNEAQGFEALVAAIGRARGCFESWGLADGQMGQHLNWLMASGAAAVKPTGSGDGGFALSLWRTSPPTELNANLIPLWARE